LITLEAALGRQRLLLLAALAAITTLAWLYIWLGAGMGMSAWDMTTASLFPHRLPAIDGGMGATWAVTVAMWWAMMVAMMTPSATPLVLLHSSVLRRQSSSAHGNSGLSLVLLLGYLLAWLAFAVVAASLQELLQPAGLLSEMMLWSRSAWFSAAVLAAAGTYQLSPLKRTCLSRCRGPASFLTQHWRAGWAGALGLGARHGAYCVGCCWLLMLLLFVGGVMNLLWIAALSVLVSLEKLSTHGESISRMAGGMLLVWALATLLV